MHWPPTLRNADVTADTNNFRAPDGDDPLDKLLHEATWPQPRPAAQTRLALAWRAAWEARLRRERLVRRAAVAAVAASFTVSAIVVWQLTHRVRDPMAPPQQADRGPVEKVVQPPDRHPAVLPRPASLPSPDERQLPRISTDAKTLATHNGDQPVFSRPPTELELLLLDACGRRRDLRPAPRPKPRAIARRTKASPNGEDASRVAAAVARLAANPQADPARISAELRSARVRSERQLIAVLRKTQPASQIAAARLLAEVGGPASVPILLEASSIPRLHDAAVAALARIADWSIVNELALRERNPDLQRALMASLLSRGDEPSLDCYLRFVENEGTSGTALSAADRVGDPPLELLFAVLNGTVEPRRIAAARVIGRIDGPATTRRLIGMIEQGTSRQEACIALLSSRGAEAVQFVEYASNDPQWQPLLQAARLLIPSNSQPRS